MTETFDGCECTLLKVRRDHFGWVEYKYYLDPRLSYAIRRIQVTVESDGRLVDEQSRQYELDERDNESLINWTIVNRSRDGEVDRRIQAKISHSKVNVKTANEDFVFDFPPETEVRHAGRLPPGR